MAKPEWNKHQKPEEKSEHHGKRGPHHGELEHGQGGHWDEEHESGPKQKPDDLTIIEPDDDEEVPA